MEKTTLVKRKKAKKIRTQPVEIHWTSFEIKEMPEGKQRQIAQQLHEYVRRPNKYTVSGFVSEINISRSVWEYWCKKYPLINRAYDDAKYYMGAKRFDAGASKLGHEKLMLWAGQYDPDAFNFLALTEKIKARNDEQKPTNITINMSRFDDAVEIEPHMIPIEEEN